MWSTLQIRFALFLIGCIGTRSLFTLASAYAPPAYLPWFGALALLPTLGWFYLIFLGERDTGAEVFGELIWWKHMRPLHMILWGFFAYLAFQRNPHAWIILATDTLVGLLSFLEHHYSEGNLSRVFG
jgi:hypothetical protein